MTTKTDKYQIGMSADANNNFVLLPDGAGSLEIKRGNLGAEGETVLKIDADGNVVDPREWVDMTASRVSGETYTNDSGMEMLVQIVALTTANNGGIDSFLQGRRAGRGNYTPASGAAVAVLLTVPVGDQYKATLQDATLQTWHEYRRQP